MASASVRGRGHHSTRSKRIPLAELPLHSFVERPPSPIKSYSSPSKLHPTALRATTNAAASSSSSSSNPVPLIRTNSAPVGSPASTGSLFREVIRNADAADKPLEEGRAIQTTKGKGRARPIFDSPKAVKSPSPLSASSLAERASASPSQQQQAGISFSPKKRMLPSVARERERDATTNRRQLLDEDEEGNSSSTNIEGGSASPRRSATKPFGSTIEAIRARPATLSDAQVNKPKLNLEGVKWSVWHDESAMQEVLMDALATPPGYANDDDCNDDDPEGKENLGPSTTSNPISRKKGTGGRLSLLATANESSDLEQSSEAGGKRRRTAADPI